MALGRFFSVLSILMAGLGAAVAWTMDVPSTLEANVEVFDGQDVGWIRGQIHLRQNPTDPTQHRILLELEGHKYFYVVSDPSAELLFSERFHDGLARGFLLDKRGKAHGWVPARMKSATAPGLEVQLDVRTGNPRVHLWLRPLDARDEFIDDRKMEKWALEDLAGQTRWQLVWVMGNWRWAKLPNLIEGQMTVMSRLPQSMAALVHMLEHPVTMDDIYFAERAAELMGFGADVVRRECQLPAGAVLGFREYALALGAIQHKQAVLHPHCSEPLKEFGHRQSKGHAH